MILAVRDQHLEAGAVMEALRNRSTHPMTEGNGHFADFIPRTSDIVRAISGRAGEGGLYVTSAGTSGRQGIWRGSRSLAADKLLSADVRSDRRPPKKRHG